MTLGLNLANSITITRIVGVGYIFWLVPFTTERIQLLTIGIFTLIAITDFLDGWVARKLKTVTELGKLLDPLADKILLLVLLPLVSMGVINPFPVFLIFAREFSVMAVRVMAAKYKFSIAASWSGKLKTAITFPICGILFARPAVELMTQQHVLLAPIIYLKRWVFTWPWVVYEVLIWSMVAIAWISFIDYLINFLWNRQLLTFNNDKQKARRALLAYIPNTITLLNMFCGVASIFLSLWGHIQFAGAVILIGMIFDGLDGKLARKLNAYSAFGEKIDTRADYITFGIAPAVLLAKFFMSISSWPITLAGIAVAILYFMAVRKRLNRFEQLGHQAFFEGMPSPIAALFAVVSLYSILSLNLWVLIGANCINAWLMVASLKYPHNDSAKGFFRLLKVPTLLLIVLIIIENLSLVSLSLPLHTMLLGLMLIYYLSPIIYKEKN